MNECFVLGRQRVRPREFVVFWEVLYEFRDEHLYDDNVGQGLTPKRVRKLFLWKNGGRLSERQKATVEKLISKIPTVRRLDEGTDAEEFLQLFPEGGAIWRIFWLHLWRPDRFPMYDQHVHRAMTWIQTGVAEEIPSYNPSKIRAYLERYRPFLRQFRGIDQRRVDRALWACGKFGKPFFTSANLSARR